MNHMWLHIILDLLVLVLCSLTTFVYLYMYIVAYIIEFDIVVLKIIKYNVSLSVLKPERDDK